MTPGTHIGHDGCGANKGILKMGRLQPQNRSLLKIVWKIAENRVVSSISLVLLSVNNQILRPL